MSNPRLSGWQRQLSLGMLCLLLAAALCGCVSREAVLVLEDIGAGDGPSRLKASTPAPSRTAVAYTVEGRSGSGDLYLPGAGAAQAGIVLVPGLVREGKDHERLVALAKTLARARFAVLAPELSGYRDLRLRPAHVRELADAWRYLAGREDLSHGTRVGFGAFSYAVGPAVLAALEDDTRERVRFVLGVGGYHDLRLAVRFVTTGYFEENGVPRRLEPSEYGKLVLASSVKEHLHDPRDRAIVEAMVEAKLADPAADIAALAKRLGPEGASVYRLVTNTDPGATPSLLQALPAEARATLDALTLADKDLGRLDAQLILVHGRNDPLIPFPETLALARAVPPSQAHTFVINRVLGHVDLGFSHVWSWRFWSEELPDAFRMLRAVELVLDERERTSGHQRARAGTDSRAAG